MTVVNILNGTDTDKIGFFTKYSGDCQIFLYPNYEKAENVFYRIKNDELFRPVRDKILITSEEQIDAIFNDNILLNWYENNKEAFLSVKFKEKPINYLCDRRPFLELKEIGKDCRIEKTNSDGLFSEQTMSDFYDRKIVIKNLKISGKQDIHFGFDINNYVGENKFSPNTEYLIQPLYDEIHHNFFKVPCIIKNEKIKYFFTLTGVNYYNYCKSTWESLKADFRNNKIIKEAIEEIINTFNITEGVIEPEFVIDFDENIRILSINAKWDYGCSSIGIFLKNAFSNYEYGFFECLVDNINIPELPENYISEEYHYGTSYTLLDNKHTYILR